MYLWYDKQKKMYYIGSHWGTEDDGYVCSSEWMKRAYKRRPQDFKRRILQEAPREILYKQEEAWLRMIKPEELGVKYYNLQKEVCRHWSSDPNTVGNKISQSKKGWVPSQETREKWSIQRLGRPSWNKGKSLSADHKNKLKGRKFTEEHKQKLSIARRNRNTNGH